MVDISKNIHEKDVVFNKISKENDQLKEAISINKVMKILINKSLIYMKEFNKEIDKMKLIIGKLDDENKKILKEKKEIEVKLSEIMQTNYAGIKKVLNEKDTNNIKENSEQTELQLTLLREEMEHVNFEKKKLKEALNEAINKCAAYVIKEKEWKKEIEEKKDHINNLTQSKKNLKETFAEQIYSLRYFFP